MEIREFKIYDGDCTVRLEITEEKKNQILERVLQFCQETECTAGEVLHQSDTCNIAAPSVLSDIIDNILKFETKFVDE